MGDSPFEMSTYPPYAFAMVSLPKPAIRRSVMLAWGQVSSACSETGNEHEKLLNVCEAQVHSDKAALALRAQPVDFHKGPP